MRLYKITALGVVAAFEGTQADAKAKAKELGGDWAEEEVPVDKAGLLAWLNANATSELNLPGK